MIGHGGGWRWSRWVLSPFLPASGVSAVPVSGVTALTGIRDARKVKAGNRVLVNGATGGVGVYAIQIAKALRAEVTAVRGPGNVELAQELEADHVIDYGAAAGCANDLGSVDESAPAGGRERWAGTRPMKIEKLREALHERSERDGVDLIEVPNVKKTTLAQIYGATRKIDFLLIVERL